MADSYEKLRQLSTEDLIRRYDHKAESTAVGLSFIREEIARREAEKQTRHMLELTRQMRALTIVITILTVINVVAVLLDILNK